MRIVTLPDVGDLVTIRVEGAVKPMKVRVMRVIDVAQMFQFSIGNCGYHAKYADIIFYDSAPVATTR